MTGQGSRIERHMGIVGVPQPRPLPAPGLLRCCGDAPTRFAYGLWDLRLCAALGEGATVRPRDRPSEMEGSITLGQGGTDLRATATGRCKTCP